VKSYAGLQNQQVRPVVPNAAGDPESGAPGLVDSRSTLVLFVASAIGLWLELALIRWVSCEVRVFAYCKNLVLVASFLGFGAGLLRWRSRADLVASQFFLLLVTLVVRLPWQAIEHFGPRRVGLILPEISRPPPRAGPRRSAGSTSAATALVPRPTSGRSSPWSGPPCRA
jgi:hypothetical protein